jgi:hypothetical protein
VHSAKIGRLSAAVICLTLMLTARASSQGAAPQQPGGLFGATRSDAAASNRLNVLITASEGLDSELPPEFASRVVQGDLQQGGLSTMLTATADYTRKRRRLQLAGTASTAVRYYQRLDRVDAVSDSAGLGASIRLPKQATLEVNQSAAYAPSYLYQLFPTVAPPALGESIPANPDYRIGRTDSYSYGTRMALVFGSSLGTSVTATAEYNHTDFRQQTATRPNLTIYASGAKFSHAMSRSGGFSIEYQYRTGEFGFGGLTKEHRLTMGVDYSPALSVRRRAIFHFNLAPSLLDIPESVLPVVDAGAAKSALDGHVPSAAEPRLYRLQGEAGVTYPFRSNWRATGSYRRRVEYLAVLTEPVFTGAARAELTGLITRRADLMAAAGYVTGASAIPGSTLNLDTRIGDVRIRYALKRSFGLYSEYQYHYYDLRGQARFAPDLPSVFGQHRVSVGFMLFATPLGK